MLADTYIHNYTYRIINTLDEMEYIGVRSCNCPIADDDYWGSSKYLDEAIKEFGKQNFTKEIIQDHDTRLAAAEQEIFFHHHYNVGANEGYYNKSIQTSTSFDMTGYKHTDETRKKMSEYHNRPEVKREKSKEQKGRVDSDETKKKKSVARMGKKLPPETIRNMAKAQKIALNRPEVKKAHIERSKEYWSHPENREAAAVLQKEIQNRPEAKKAHSEIMTEVANRPEVKAKKAAALSKLCSALGVEYKSLKAAHEATGIPKATLSGWCNSPHEKHNDYFYISIAT